MVGLSMVGYHHWTWTVIAGAPSAPGEDDKFELSRTWSGTLYRNGGYFGQENSDQKIEHTR